MKIVRFIIPAVILSIGFFSLNSAHSLAQSQYYHQDNSDAKASAEENRENTPTLPPPLAKAASDKKTRQESITAISQIPLTPQNSAQAYSVLNNISVFRRLPVFRIPADGEFVKYLANNPDIVVNIWEKIGISQISVLEQGKGLYRVSDIAGTSGTMKNLWSGENGVLYYMEGGYRGNLLARHVRGKALILVRFNVQRDASGLEYTTCFVDTFLSLDQDFYDAATKLLFPMLGRVADNNLEQSLFFVYWYSDRCKRSPYNMASFALELKNARLETRQGLARQTFSTAKRNGYDLPELNFAQADSSVASVWSTPEPVQPQLQPQPAIPVRVAYPPVDSAYAKPTKNDYSQGIEY